MLRRCGERQQAQVGCLVVRIDGQAQDNPKRLCRDDLAGALRGQPYGLEIPFPQSAAHLASAGDTNSLVALAGI
jgi:hypothetical protein